MSGLRVDLVGRSSSLLSVEIGGCSDCEFSIEFIRDPETMALLEVLHGDLSEKMLPLSDENIVIGRHPGSNIVLDNHAVSRRHARITRSNGLYFIEDLRSRNGTWLNGERIQSKTPLRDDDEIRVCEVKFRFLTAAPVGVGATRSSFSTTTGDMPVVSEQMKNELFDSTPEPILSSMDLTTIRSSRLTIKPEVKLKALLEIIDSIRSKLSLDDLLPCVIGELIKIFPQAERGIFLMPDDSGEFRIRSSILRREDQRTTTRISKTLLDEVLTRKQAILSEDAESDTRFRGSESLHELRVRSMMCVPLLSRTSKVIGIVQLESKDVQSKFTEEDLELLGSTASIVGLSVENAALHEETLRKHDLERELEFATQVQLGFLPTERPRIPNYEFVDYYEPAHSVGGDIFDYIDFKDGRWAIVVGDVAGKGVPAALLMARVYSLIRGQVTPNRTASEALTALNHAVSSSGLGHSFITVALLILDPISHTIEWANAGHVPPLVRCNDGIVEELSIAEPDFPLGVKVDQTYHNRTRRLKDGELVVLVTDGVSETMNSRRQLFGTDRIKTFLAKTYDHPHTVMEGLIEEVEKFRGQHPQHDDMCVIAFQRRS